MIPPTKSHLQAMAGWSLTLPMADMSSEQELAVRKFRDGCGQLAQVVDSLPLLQRADGRGEVVRPNACRPGPAFSVNIPVDVPVIPEEVQAALGVDSDGECRHRFDIRTQRCLYCGSSYRQVRGRKPELF